MFFIDTFRSVGSIVLEVCVFWWVRLFTWISSKSQKQLLLESLRDAKLYEEWEASAIQLDWVMDYDAWRETPHDKYYDNRLIRERFVAIMEARKEDNIMELIAILRSGLVRNLGNITDHHLFNYAYGGTKDVIDAYVTEVARAIEYVTHFPITSELQGGLSQQAKLDTLHDTRQAFGRTALVLQGGSIFGLCHIGVVKALHLRGLLPRIIVGTATGALIAALVGVHTETELLKFLTPEGIDLTAFMRRSDSMDPAAATNGYNFEDESWFATTIRRLKRLLRQGQLLDVAVLEECVKANVGELTFEEAYRKTKRVLNITVPTTNTGVPILLNYLTSPHVLIWSAALASNASTGTFITLMCKDEAGQVVPWPNARDNSFAQNKNSRHPERESPLARLGELFNVNHFIISQARPYIAPFLRSDFQHVDPRQLRSWRFTIPLARLLMLEVQHRLRQFESFFGLPAAVRRFFLDENIPGPSLTLVPDLTPTDYVRLLENPSAASMQHWILKGERSVWPAVAALRTRCIIEVELDRGYQHVRRRKPFDTATPGIHSRRESNSGSLRRRSRAGSFATGGPEV